MHSARSSFGSHQGRMPGYVAPAGQAMPAMPGAPGVGQAAPAASPIYPAVVEQVLSVHGCAQYLAMNATARVDVINDAFGRLGILGPDEVALLRSRIGVGMPELTSDEIMLLRQRIGFRTPTITAGVATVYAGLPSPYDAYDRAIVGRCGAQAAQRRMPFYAAPRFPYPAAQAAPVASNAAGQLVDQSGNPVLDANGNPVQVAPPVTSITTGAPPPTTVPTTPTPQGMRMRGYGRGLLNLAITVVVIGGAAYAGSYYGARAAHRS